MKRILLFLCCVLNANVVFSLVGKHNLTLTMGGGFDVFNMQEIQPVAPSLLKTLPNLKYLGGGLSLTMGYMYYYNKTERMIYGVDLHAVLDFSFTQEYHNQSLFIFKPKFYTITGMLGIAFQVGYRFDTYRVLADLIGIRLGGGTFLDYTNSINEAQKLGNTMMVGLYLPGGFQTVFDYGLIVGLRHAVNFYLPLGTWYKQGIEDSGLDIINYSLYASIGFMIDPSY